MYSDPDSNRSWNLCWLILEKVKNDRLVPYYAGYQAAMPTMWGGRNPSKEEVQLLATAFARVSLPYTTPQCAPAWHVQWLMCVHPAGMDLGDRRDAAALGGAAVSVAPLDPSSVFLHCSRVGRLGSVDLMDRHFSGVGVQASVSHYYTHQCSMA